MTDTALRIFDSIELDENQVDVIIVALENYAFKASKLSEDMLMETSRRHNAEISELASATAKVLRDLYKQADLE